MLCPSCVLCLVVLELAQTARTRQELRALNRILHASCPVLSVDAMTLCVVVLSALQADYPNQIVPAEVVWYYQIELGCYFPLLVTQFWDVQRKDFTEACVDWCHELSKFH